MGYPQKGNVNSTVDGFAHKLSVVGLRFGLGLAKICLSILYAEQVEGCGSAFRPPIPIADSAQGPIICSNEAC